VAANHAAKILTGSPVNRDDPEEWAQFCCERCIESRRAVDWLEDAGGGDTLQPHLDLWLSAERAFQPGIADAELDRCYLARRAALNQKQRDPRAG
jgi:hypothetical protein